MSAVQRHRAPIRRLHADGSECAHRIAPNGRPREGQDCCGIAAYGSLPVRVGRDGCDPRHRRGAGTSPSHERAGRERVMSAAELAVRLLVAVACWAMGAAVLLPVLGDRRGLAGVGVLVAVGVASFAIAVCWPPRDGGDHG